MINFDRNFKNKQIMTFLHVELCDFFFFTNLQHFLKSDHLGAIKCETLSENKLFFVFRTQPTL